MFISTNNFLVTIICEENVLGHLLENIKKFAIESYTVEKVDFAKKSGEAAPGHRVQVLCTRFLYAKVMEYLNKYYVKDYGVIFYMNEVGVPL